MAHLLGSSTDRLSTLVPFGDPRLRPDRATTRPVADADEPLACVAIELGRELDADAVLVAWHAPGEAPAFLFSSGSCAPHSSVEHEMLGAASAALADPATPVRWAVLDDDAESEAMLTTSVGATGGVFTVTALFRRIGDVARVGGAARVGVRETAMRMLPMVQGFLRLWSMRARALAANRGLAAALDSSDVATMLVDADGRLVFVNAAAERLLAVNDGVRRAGPLLSGTRLADTMRLQATIEHVVHGGDGPAVPSPVVALRRKSGRPLLAAVVAARQEGGAAGDAAAIVHLFDPDGDLEPLLVPVCRLYALSPTEGRLASLLARGYALADAAKAMRVQEQTARSYLKQVFLKTDTNRQAELVWLMLKSAVRTAPGHPTRLV